MFNNPLFTGLVGLAIGWIAQWAWDINFYRKRLRGSIDVDRAAADRQSLQEQLKEQSTRYEMLSSEHKRARHDASVKISELEGKLREAESLLAGDVSMKRLGDLSIEGPMAPLSSSRAVVEVASPGRLAHGSAVEEVVDELVAPVPVAAVALAPADASLVAPATPPMGFRRPVVRKPVAPPRRGPFIPDGKIVEESAVVAEPEPMDEIAAALEPEPVLEAVSALEQEPVVEPLVETTVSPVEGAANGQYKQYAKAVRRDPLYRINGIGSKYQTMLYQAGVSKFSQIATMTPDELLAIIKPEAWRKVNVEEWIEEAMQFADGAPV
jgi:predicted flap endonuclease-1-like 5' DNA nuclease